MGLFGKPGDAKPATPNQEPFRAPAAPPAPGVPVQPRTTNNTCVIGPKTVVKGELHSDEDVLVEGNVARAVELQASGRLTGNIRAPKIVIAEGAMFKGNSDMSGRKDERKDKAAVS